MLYRKTTIKSFMDDYFQLSQRGHLTIYWEIYFIAVLIEIKIELLSIDQFSGNFINTSMITFYESFDWNDLVTDYIGIFSR